MRSPTSESRTRRQTSLLPAENASSSLVPDTRAATTNLRRSLDILHIVEIDADERIAAVVTFDLDDIDAAFAELDARYLAGEAAAYARTWSVICRVTPRSTGASSPRRHQIGSTSTTGEGQRSRPVDIPELLTAAWNVTSDLNIYIEAVHRLNNLGAVVTHVAHGTSQEGFDAEWRVVTF